jgi:hypothetical protein
MNTKDKGDLAKVRAMAYYVGKQFEVLLPLGDRKKYDFVVDDGTKLSKVQCKYTSCKTAYGKYEAQLRVMGGNRSFHTVKRYQKGDFDIYYVLTESGDEYEIPADVALLNKSTITLGSKYEKYKL